MARQECKEGTFRRGELLRRFMAKKLFGQSDKRYNQEYWGRPERNQRWWKEKQLEGRKMEMITEEEETEEEKLGVREWMEEDNNKMGNMVNPYYKLQENSSGQGNLRGGWCCDLAKMAKSIFIFILFYFHLFSY